MNTLLMIIALLAINAFFVAAEFALVKARSVRITQLAEGGSRAALLTARIHGNLEPYLAACQLGITMASLGLGWVGEPAVAALLEPLFTLIGIPQDLLHPIAFICGFLLFSSLHIVIGEQVPKTWAIRSAEQVSLWVAYPLRWAYLLVWPLNWALNWASGKILHLMNVEEATHLEVFNDAELKDLVSTSREHGVMETQKADMLHNLLDFDHRTVSRVMIPRGATHVLDLAADAADNQQVVATSGHSRFPLIDSSRDNVVIGVVLAKSLYLATLNGRTDAFDHLEQFALEPMIVPENQQVSSLFEQMRSARTHLALAVDEYGEFVGIITLEDLLEEIVGDIEDEQDTHRTAEDIVPLAENQWLVAGIASLLDIERELGFPRIDDREINTVAGILMKHLQRFPAPGDSIILGDFVLEVRSLLGRRVENVLISRQPNPTTDETPPPPGPEEPQA